MTDWIENAGEFAGDYFYVGDWLKSLVSPAKIEIRAILATTQEPKQNKKQNYTSKHTWQVSEKKKKKVEDFPKL